jgi:outer membrane protein TolC
MNLKTPHNVPTFRYRLLLAGLVLLLTASATRVYADQVITLEQVLAVALEKNQTLLAGRSEKEAADARVTQATASYYPQLTATAGYDHIWIDTLNTITNRDVTDDYD